MAVPVTASVASQHVIIGVGDMAASDNVQAVLSTYALGSCIGLVAYDPLAKVGGILHLMLPDSSIAPDKAAAQPAMFADTGLPRFFKLLASFHSRPAHLQLFVAGGANVILGHDPFRIGERNMRATVDYLARHGYVMRQAQIGGSVNRTLHLELATGGVTIKTPSYEERISLAG
jgi:chemotaxis protein CheD